MTINALILPSAFVEALRQKRFIRTRGSWELLEGKDAWGNPLEAGLGEVFDSEERITQETERLMRDFPSNPSELFYGPDPSENEPGFIPPLTDFSKVICFGVSGEDDPFCLDFRTDPKSPEIIWWEDTYWRRIAPDWTSFMALFDWTK